MDSWEFNDEFTPEDFLHIVECLEEPSPNNLQPFLQAPTLTPKQKKETYKEKDRQKTITIMELHKEIEQLRKEIEVRDAQLYTMYYHLLNLIKNHL